MVEQSVLGIFQRICISQSNNVNVGFGLWNRTQEEKGDEINSLQPVSMYVLT